MLSRTRWPPPNTIYSRKATLGIVVNATGGVPATVPEQPRAFEQEADVFILACGAVDYPADAAVQIRPLPNGTANGSIIGRSVTFHSYSSANRSFTDPIIPGLIMATSVQFDEVLRPRRLKGVSASSGSHGLRR